jgi:hypothetical protein
LLFNFAKSTELNPLFKTKNCQTYFLIYKMLIWNIATLNFFSTFMSHSLRTSQEWRHSSRKIKQLAQILLMLFKTLIKLRRSPLNYKSKINCKLTQNKMFSNPMIKKTWLQKFLSLFTKIALQITMKSAFTKLVKCFNQRRTWQLRHFKNLYRSY